MNGINYKLIMSTYGYNACNFSDWFKKFSKVGLIKGIWSETRIFHVLEPSNKSRVLIQIHFHTVWFEALVLNVLWGKNCRQYKVDLKWYPTSLHVQNYWTILLESEFSKGNFNLIAVRFSTFYNINIVQTMP